MNQFEALYKVWLLEPDYAKKNFYEIYGAFERFVEKFKPTEEELKRAKEIAS